MNHKNLKKVIKWLEDLPENEFDMGDYYSPNGADFTGWTDTKEEYVELDELFVEHADLPCGTACCLAGLIQFNAAKTRYARMQSASQFAQIYLGIGNSQAHNLFYSCTYYDKASLEYVTKKDVLSKLYELRDAQGLGYG